MSLVIQRGFWQDTVMANTREKLAELYHDNPEIAQSDKRCLIEFWSTYEGLSDLLGDKWQGFVEWFLKTTSPETISRCLRALKEDGTITIDPEKAKQRQEQENDWRHYFGSEKRLMEEG